MIPGGSGPSVSGFPSCGLLCRGHGGASRILIGRWMRLVVVGEFCWPLHAALLGCGAVVGVPYMLLAVWM